MSVLNPELVLGWIFMALINGEVAATRGRGRWRWMAVSAVLGPLATLLLVGLPDGAHPGSVNSTAGS